MNQDNLLSTAVELWREYQIAKQGDPLAHDVNQLKAALDRVIVNLANIDKEDL